MRLHNHNTLRFLSLLGDYVSRDTGSITGWSCLVLRGLLADESAANLQKINDRLQGIDGSIITGAEGDLLLLFRAQQGAGQNRLTEMIGEALGQPTAPSSACFDLSLNRSEAAAEFGRQVNLLRGQSDQEELNVKDALTEEGLDFMAKVFDNSKFVRQYRRPMTVLLVEDDAMTCRLAGNLLKREYVLVTAANAYEAVVNYLIYAPEIVFLDINLPDESGFNVLRQLTACDSEAYIVMFSGNDGLENIIDARERGARGFVTKPFHKDRLQHYLHERERLRTSH